MTENQYSTPADRREREMENPPADRQEDMAAELKRLRRENEVLRQEREILKRATAFYGWPAPHRAALLVL
jgi:transposase-like protein